MPRAIPLLAFGIFAMVTSEFAVAGLMPQMAEGLDTTVPRIGYLITAFAAAMALGGPVLTVALLRLPPKNALLVLFALFLASNVMAATATGYGTMLAARILGGVASQALFGTAISLAVRLVGPERRGRAIAVTLNGLMLGTLLGLPLSTLVGERHGWRAAFWVITALALLAALATAVGVPKLERHVEDGGFRAQLAVFRSRALWTRLLTSTCVIAATFSAFSYATPILTDVTGLATSTIPLLLVAYGAATVVGNTVVGRLADRHALPVLATGLGLNALFLAAFALLTDLPPAAVAAFLGIGLVGVTMNPAMATRVQHAANAGPLVNTVHASFITLGIILSSAVGGLVIGAAGLRAPLWLGAAFALAGLALLLPELTARRGAPAVLRGSAM
ncbi:MFS transporter [Streptomyces avicenniae]|uniref:MFS transporter n=1 Tax=Streptomyces avicenniae TaxID=500153 RepID=UPI00069A34F5|nr:MFS transporter [Streptomyces avicenniae]